MKFKNYLLLIFVLSLLSCVNYKLDEDACEVCGNYYFRYIDKTQVEFCGWTRDSIDKLEGDMYVPEKIYNLNVVEIAQASKVYRCGYSYEKLENYMKGIKSIVIPTTVKTIKAYAFSGCQDIKRVSFKETSNWYTKNLNNNTWMSIDVSDSSRNATELMAGRILQRIE